MLRLKISKFRSSKATLFLSPIFQAILALCCRKTFNKLSAEWSPQTDRVREGQCSSGENWVGCC